MPVKDYTQAKIYKIHCLDSECFYIGSTTNRSLAKRLQYHKKSARETPDRKVYKHIADNGSWDAWQITMVEKLDNITNDEELRMKEEEHRVKHHGQPYLLNSNRAYTTKEQAKEDHKEYREDNREAISEQRKQYRQDNREAISEHKKEHYKLNREAILEQKKEYQQDNKESIAEKAKQHYESNRESILEKMKIYRQDNRESISEKMKIYYESNKEILNERKRIKIRCNVCDCLIVKSAFARHERSNKHKMNLLEVKTI